MAKTIYIGSAIVSVFGCGTCREKGPCFQITACGAKDGGWAVIHRAEMPSIVAIVNVELGAGVDRLSGPHG